LHGDKGHVNRADRAGQLEKFRKSTETNLRDKRKMEFGVQEDSTLSDKSRGWYQEGTKCKSSTKRVGDQNLPRKRENKKP